MSEHAENTPPPVNPLKRAATGIGTGPRKRPCATDPYVHHGRHFGRTVLLMCNVDNIINTGLLRCNSADDEELEYSPEEERAWTVFNILLESIPSFQKELEKEDPVRNKEIAELIQKGINGARADDTRQLKGAILEWITTGNEPLNPPLSRAMKSDRGFNHPITGSLLCPAILDWSDPNVRADLRDQKIAVPGDQWPLVLWRDCKYDSDDPWKGLLRNEILVKAFKCIFLSPSSLEKEPRATRSCNSKMHGMIEVTAASLVYVATQVRFALHSSSVFTKTDRATDSERFYFTLLNLLENPVFIEEVANLLNWWNGRVFPGASRAARPITTGSALANIMERGALKAVDLNSRRSSS